MRKNAVFFNHLKFDRDKENAYRHYLEHRDKYHIRVVFSIFIFLYAFFSITDYYLLPEYLVQLAIVRFGIVIPCFIVTILLTFHKDSGL